VIPGCTRLDVPQAAEADDSEAGDTAAAASSQPNASRKRKGAAAEGEETRA
jgi:hypothetical protein